MNGIKIFLLIVYLSSAFISFSQDTIEKKKDYINTDYIEKYPGFPTGYLSIYGKYNNISIIDTSGTTLIFRPNIAASFGPGFGYKWFGIDLSFISFGQKDESIYGKTTKLDIQSHVYLKRFVLDFILQDYKGFYLDSIIRHQYDTVTINLARIIKKPDMTQQSLGGSIMLFTNYKRFSYKSTFSQTEFQKKSAGTWAFGLNFHYLKLNSNTCLIDDSLKQYFDSTSYYKSITTYNAGVIGGYLRTFTLKRWFTTLSLLGGFDGKLGTYTLENGSLLNDTNTLSGRINFRFGIGYNSKRVYFGFNAIADAYFLTNSIQKYGVLRWYLGYRFIPKKFRT